MSSATTVRDHVSVIVAAVSAVHVLQLERGTTGLFVGSGRDTDFRAALDDYRNGTDARLGPVRTVAVPALPSFSATRRVTDLLDGLAAHRAGVDGGSINGVEALDYYTRLNAALLEGALDALSAVDNPEAFAGLMAVASLTLVKEQLGLQRGEGSLAITQGFFSPGQRSNYCLLVAREEARTAVYTTFAKGHGYPPIDTGLLEGPVLAPMRARFLEDGNAFAVTEPNDWFGNMTIVIDRLHAQELLLMDLARDEADDDLYNARAIIIVVALCTAVLVALLIVASRLLVEAVEAKEGALRDAIIRAQAAAKTKAMFLSNMSHEIRTPLNGIIGTTVLMADTNMSAEQRDYCDTLTTCSGSLLVLVNDILDFAKIDAGLMVLESTRLDLRAVIEHAVQIMSSAVRGREQELLYYVDDDVPPAVLGDSLRLNQVLLNFLSNASKFSPHGETIVIRVSARPVAREQPLAVTGVSSVSATSSSVHRGSPSATSRATAGRLSQSDDAASHHRQLQQQRGRAGSSSNSSSSSSTITSADASRHHVVNIVAANGGGRGGSGGGNDVAGRSSAQSSVPPASQSSSLHAGVLHHVVESHVPGQIPPSPVRSASSSSSSSSAASAVGSTVARIGRAASRMLGRAAGRRQQQQQGGGDDKRAADDGNTSVVGSASPSVSKSKKATAGLSSTASTYRTLWNKRSTTKAASVQAVTPVLEPPTYEVTLSVTDRGIGISAEEVDRLFVEFTQVHHNHKYGGTGLGLSISRRLVELMGGRVTVESKLGAGSTFAAVVPFRAFVDPKTGATSAHDAVAAEAHALVEANARGTAPPGQSTTPLSLVYSVMMTPSPSSAAGSLLRRQQRARVALNVYLVDSSEQSAAYIRQMLEQRLLRQAGVDAVRWHRFSDNLDAAARAHIINEYRALDTPGGAGAHTLYCLLAVKPVVPAEAQLLLRGIATLFEALPHRLCVVVIGAKEPATAAAAAAGGGTADRRDWGAVSAQLDAYQSLSLLTYTHKPLIATALLHRIETVLTVADANINGGAEDVATALGGGNGSGHGGRAFLAGRVEGGGGGGGGGAASMEGRAMRLGLLLQAADTPAAGSSSSAASASRSSTAMAAAAVQLSPRNSVHGGSHHSRFPAELASEKPHTILIVDDQPTNCKVLCRMIEKMGYTGLTVVHNGLEAVCAIRRRNAPVAVRRWRRLAAHVRARAQGQQAAGAAAWTAAGDTASGSQEPFDIVLMDVQMPEMDGMRASRYVRTVLAHARIQQPRIVAVTANILDGNWATKTMARFDDWISKPVKVPELVQVLRGEALVSGDLVNMT